VECTRQKLLKRALSTSVEAFRLTKVLIDKVGTTGTWQIAQPPTALYAQPWSCLQAEIFVGVLDIFSTLAL
jgi:hypothetical protein